MIIIYSNQLEINKEDLPFCDLFEYDIVKEKKVMEIKLKTVAKSSSCEGVFIHDVNEQDFSIKGVEDKVWYFSDMASLVKILEKGNFSNDSEELTVETENTDVEETTSFDMGFSYEEVEQIQEYEQEKQENDFVNLDDSLEIFNDISEKDDILDNVLRLPNLDVDIDSLKLQLENKQKIIEQKNAMILELQNQIDSLYKLQENHMLELKQEYENKIDEAQKVIDKLKQDLDNFALDEVSSKFLKYKGYADNYRGVLNDGLTNEERLRLDVVKSKFHIFVSGGMISFYDMMAVVKSKIEKGTDAIIVDMTSDYYLMTLFKVKSKQGVMDILSTDISEIVRKVGNNVDYIPSYIFNDIVYLTIDWVEFINKLNRFAQGRDVIIIMGNLYSFASRVGVSKLASVGDVYVFGSANPANIISLSKDLTMFECRIKKVIILKYIDTLNEIITNLLSKKYSVLAVKGDSVDWGKIGLKI